MLSATVGSVQILRRLLGFKETVEGSALPLRVLLPAHGEKVPKADEGELTRRSWTPHPRFADLLPVRGEKELDGEGFSLLPPIAAFPRKALASNDALASHL